MMLLLLFLPWVRVYRHPGLSHYRLGAPLLRGTGLHVTRRAGDCGMAGPWHTVSIQGSPATLWPGASDNKPCARALRRSAPTRIFSRREHVGVFAIVVIFVPHVLDLLCPVLF